MKLIIHPDYLEKEWELKNLLQNFESEGTLLVKGSRNTIKLFNTDWLTLNVKSFKKPNALNSFIYKYLRASKAKRSYQFALKLIEKNIGTPQPIAYAEISAGLRLGKSFYVCEHIKTEYTFRDLVENPNLPNHEAILRAFTQFCFKLHENGVEFKDHSPGNTLIKQTNQNAYAFYLVDLNRMTFHSNMSFEMRMYNLRRLTPKKEMIAVMANEYAKLYQHKTETEIFTLMWKLTEDFQQKFHRKQKLKKRIKFWKR